MYRICQPSYSHLCFAAWATKRSSARRHEKVQDNDGPKVSIERFSLLSELYLDEQSYKSCGEQHPIKIFEPLSFVNPLHCCCVL